MTNLTKQEFIHAFNAADQVIVKWNASNGPRTIWNGREVKCISEAVVTAVQDLQDLIATLDVDDDAKLIILQLDQFYVDFESWANDSEINPDETNPAGAYNMWQHWDSVKTLITRPPRTKPEPISALVEQQVGDRQIALIYGWRDAAGNPDLARVQREKLQPGSEYVPDKWVHPVDIREIEQANEAWKSRRPSGSPSRKIREPLHAPETVDELLQQGVSSKQIIRMKPGVSYEEIRAIAVAKGYRLDGVVYAPSKEESTPANVVNHNQNLPGNAMQIGFDPAVHGTDRTMHQQVVAPEVYEGDPEKLAYLRSSVIDLHDKQLTPEQIVMSLSEDFPSLDVSHVRILVEPATLAGL